MTFSVFYDTQAEKFLSKLDKQYAVRIMDKTEQLLGDNAVPHEAKAIVGEHGVFRLRVSDFRVLYRVNYLEKRVIVFKIDKREKVY
jgi:mRNA interferase RelE/StbE